LLFEQVRNTGEPHGKTPSKGDIQKAHHKKLCLLKQAALHAARGSHAPSAGVCTGSRQLSVIETPTICKFWLSRRALQKNLSLDPITAKARASPVLAAHMPHPNAPHRWDCPRGGWGHKLEGHLLLDGGEVEGKKPLTANL